MKMLFSRQLINSKSRQSPMTMKLSNLATNYLLTFNSPDSTRSQNMTAEEERR